MLRELELSLGSGIAFGVQPRLDLVYPTLCLGEFGLSLVHPASDLFYRIRGGQRQLRRCCG
jgi:hypothetical protein